MAESALPHDTIIQDSWTRCRDFGLTHQSTPVFTQPSPGDVTALLESQQALVQTTHKEVLP